MTFPDGEACFFTNSTLLTFLQLLCKYYDIAHKNLVFKFCLLVVNHLNYSRNGKDAEKRKGVMRAIMQFNGVNYSGIVILLNRIENILVQYFNDTMQKVQ